jgi:hypothetical protein
VKSSLNVIIEENKSYVMKIILKAIKIVNNNVRIIENFISTNDVIVYIKIKLQIKYKL